MGDMLFKLFQKEHMQQVILQNYRYFALFASSQETDRNLIANAITTHDTLQVLRLCHGFVGGGDDDIEVLQLSQVRRTVLPNFEYLHAELLGEIQAAAQRIIQSRAHRSEEH